jgi:protein required for attachment to host cells
MRTAPGGRPAGPVGWARHGFDPHDTVEEQARQRFSQHVIATLEREWQRAAADHLILAAPAKMLGVLRAQIKDGLAEAPRTDVAKTLTGIPLQDLPGHFEELLKL